MQYATHDANVYADIYVYVYLHLLLLLSQCREKLDKHSNSFNSLTS